MFSKCLVSFLLLSSQLWRTNSVSLSRTTRNVDSQFDVSDSTSSSTLSSAFPKDESSSLEEEEEDDVASGRGEEWEGGTRSQGSTSAWGIATQSSAENLHQGTKLPDALVGNLGRISNGKNKPKQQQTQDHHHQQQQLHQTVYQEPQEEAYPPTPLLLPSKPLNQQGPKTEPSRALNTDPPKPFETFPESSSSRDKEPPSGAKAGTGSDVIQYPYAISPYEELSEAPLSGYGRGEDLSEGGGNCPPALKEGEREWRSGNRVVQKPLQHWEPNTCNPPIKCRTSTTEELHIYLQNGDSLQVMLQKPPPNDQGGQPPLKTSLVAVTSSIVSDGQKRGAAGEGQQKITPSRNPPENLLVNDPKATGHVPSHIKITSNTNNLSISIKGPMDSSIPSKGNSTHLFSREDHHVNPAISAQVPHARRKRELNKREKKTRHEASWKEGKEGRKEEVKRRKGDGERGEEEDGTASNGKRRSRSVLGDEKTLDSTSVHSSGITLLSSLTIWKVTKLEWGSCSTREGGQVTQSSSDGLATVPQEFLPVGINYFIGRSSWSSSECFKLTVIVRDANCGEGSICSGKGICFSNSSMEEFACGCCTGFSGVHCEERNACQESRCLNSGYCVDIVEGHDGETFQCLCPSGYVGQLCDTPSTLCDSNPCKNGRICQGNHTSYSCECASGWTGNDCLDELAIYATDEQRDEISPFTDPMEKSDFRACSSTKCDHGICIETTDQEARCFCQPGFGGERCEFEYDECCSNPCPNGGTCIDQIGSFQCICGAGYTGHNCMTKLNLCDPNPCPSNRICNDVGNTYTCDCGPGLSDDDCETSEEVCIPNPCANGATCSKIAETLSFYCACRPGFTGQTCQEASILESVGPYGTGEPVEELDLQHSSFSNSLPRMKNIYTGVVTLACAFFIFLLVVSICHCRVNHPHNKCSLPLPRPSLRILPYFARRRSISLREKKRRERSASMRFDCDLDGPSSSMTSYANADSVFYNMDVGDNQELPLIK